MVIIKDELTKRKTNEIKIGGRRILTNLDYMTQGYDNKSRFNSDKKQKALFKDIPGKMKTNMKNNIRFSDKPCKLLDIHGKSITKERLMSALMRNDGRLLKAMKELKIDSYCNLQKFLQTNAEFHELEKYFRARLIERSEDVLLDCLDSDDKALRLKASMFILETVGKDRGYSKQKDMPLINVDLRNNPAELENKIKSIFSITSSTSKPTEEIEYNIKEIEEDKDKEVKEEEIDEEDKDNEIDIEVS